MAVAPLLPGPLVGVPANCIVVKPLTPNDVSIVPLTL